MADTTKPIVVIGSINMDLVCRAAAMPVPGQTIVGSEFHTIPGGKGANQAVAAAKLSPRAPVHFVGRVGDDDFGQRLLNGLSQHHVRTGHVTVTEGVSSGIALIIVDKKGENSIVVASGANARVSIADINSAEDLIASAAVVVLQLEIPYETVRHAIALCKRHGIFTILDPAPAPSKALSRGLFAVDLFSPNQSEAEAILGFSSAARTKRKGVIDPKQTASDLLARGARSIVLKLGAKGALSLSDDGKIELAKPPRVKVVDTTAAGDAFTAALAVAHAEGMPRRDALRFANAAGAAACMTFGAQPSLPSRASVDKLLQ